MKVIDYVTYVLVLGLLALPATAQTSSTGSSNSSTGAQTGSSTSGQSSSTYGSSSSSQGQKFDGTIVVLDVPTNSITIRTSDGQQRRFTADANTRFNLSHAGSSMSDLRSGQQVTITAKGNQALEIEEYRGSGMGQSASSGPASGSSTMSSGSSASSQGAYGSGSSS